jgi:molybdate/tungstate transport system substrate-binding protein
MKSIQVFLLVISQLVISCQSSLKGKKEEIIIFHAGSLSVPLKEISEEYEKLNPGTSILLESAGSLVCARKITELKKPCDIMASSDYFVINELLIPDYASWSIKFATNEIVIAYNDKSKYSAELTSENWMDILGKEDVIYSRADPDSDPCGYRTVFTFMLAEKYYRRPGLEQKMILKNKDYIRPKEVDLVALLESNAIDYMFQYKSVAIQHGLKYLELPDEINLADPGKEDLYKTVSLDVAGETPGAKMKVTGDYINYSLTLLDKAPNRAKAIDFLEFIISEKGAEIFRKNGQTPLNPLSTEQPDKIPETLQKYLN